MQQITFTYLANSSQLPAAPPPASQSQAGSSCRQELSCPPAPAPLFHKTHSPFSQPTMPSRFTWEKASVPYRDLGSLALSGPMNLSSPPAFLQFPHCAPGTKGFSPFLKCTRLFLFRGKIRFVFCSMLHSPPNL